MLAPFRLRTALLFAALTCAADSLVGQESAQALSMRRIQLGPVRIVAGQSIAIRWPTAEVPWTTVTSVESSPALAFPLRVTVDATTAELQLRLITVPGTPPGRYQLNIVGISLGGRQLAAQAEVVVAAATVPKSLSGKNPVILLNGFQAACNPLRSTSTIGNSADTFGQLSTLLSADDIPVAFFNNCSYGDIAIEQLAAQLGVFIANLTYIDGSPVTQQVDLVAHSMGGLIARAYLAGMQLDGSVAPVTDPRVRKLVQIATPNFGSFKAPNVGVQAPEMVPGSAFLWNLSRWNQNQDDLRGVDAVAIIGNAGNHYALGGQDDGVVSLTSGSLKFTRSDQRTRIVPYCHVTPDPVTRLGMDCDNNHGIADVDGPSHYSAQIVRSFLVDTPAWMAVGSSPAQNLWLSQTGGVYFAVENAAGTQYLNDLKQVSWGKVNLQNGGASGAVYYDEFIQGPGTFQFVSASLGTVGCGSYTQPTGQYFTYRCKYGPFVNSVTPRVAGSSAALVQSGITLTINGSGLGQQCSTCQVLAYPGNISLNVGRWTDQAIDVSLPLALTGLVQLLVRASGGVDSINVIAVRGPAAQPTITGVVNAFSGTTPISANSWVTISGANLAPDQRSWQSSDFANNRLPTALDGLSVTFNGKNAYLYYISSTQLNVLTPPDLGVGTVQVKVNNNGLVSNQFNVQVQQYSPSFFTFDGMHITGTHADGTLLGPTSLYPGASTPANPNETVVLYANGFGPTSTPVISGALAQSGNLPTLPVVKINGAAATVLFAGLVSPGTFQFNVIVPASAAFGDNLIVATYNGLTTQAGVSLAVATNSSIPSSFVLYGVDRGSGGQSTLYQIDPTSGQTQRIGTLPYQPVTDIAFTPDGQLYGIEQQDIFFGFSASAHLIRIDPLTGAVIGVGNSDVGQVSSLVADIDGTLYAATADSKLLRIDRSTGQPSLVGAFGPGYISSGDLVFDSQGQLYATIAGSGIGGSDFLAVIDKHTGVGTVIGDIGFKQVYGLAFLPDGRLVGVGNGEGPVATLIRIDTLSGRGTQIAPLSNATGMYGLAGGLRTWPSRLTLLHQLTARSVDQNSCTVPTSTTTFSPQDLQAYVWFDVANARQGDRINAVWRRPDGSNQATASWSTLSEDGYHCFWGSLNVLGNSAASLPGSWRVDVDWNGTLLFTSTFNISTH